MSTDAPDVAAPVPPKITVTAGVGSLAVTYAVPSGAFYGVIQVRKQGGGWLVGATVYNWGVIGGLDPVPHDVRVIFSNNVPSQVVTATPKPSPPPPVSPPAPLQPPQIMIFMGGAPQ